MSYGEIIQYETDVWDSYNASDAQLEDIENKLDHVLGTETGEYCSVILSSSNIGGYFGRLGRSLEVRRGFGEMPEAMLGLEDTTKFIYTFDRGVDTRPRVTHVTRFLQPNQSDPLKVVGDILNDLSDQVDLTEAAAYHNVDDPGKCLYLTTDLSVPGIYPARTRPYGLFAYRTMFEYASQEGFSHIFAYMNKKSLRNLGRLGISPEPLCGRSDYIIPPMAGMTFEAYQPFVVSSNEATNRPFTDPNYARNIGHWAGIMAGADLPVVRLDDNSSPSYHNET